MDAYQVDVILQYLMFQLGKRERERERVPQVLFDYILKVAAVLLF